MWALCAVLFVSLQDGTLTPWLIENACVSLLAFLRCVVLARFGPMAPMASFGVSNLLLVEGSVALQAVLNATWYRSVAVFHDRPPQHALADMACNVLRSTLPVHVVTVALMAVACAHDADDACAIPVGYAAIDDALGLRFADVAWKAAAFRALADVTFYVTHRAQHHPLLYSWLHARHHKHRRTSLRTNFQFTPIDLLLEGSLPSAVATVMLQRCGVGFSLLELTLCVAYVQWYQIGSHSAKDVDSITAVPPLAPLVNWSRLRWLRPAALRMHRHVRFHSVHHRCVVGNFGISPWMDVLLGTVVPQATKDSASS